MRESRPDSGAEPGDILKRTRPYRYRLICREII